MRKHYQYTHALLAFLLFGPTLLLGALAFGKEDISLPENLYPGLGAIALFMVLSFAFGKIDLPGSLLGGLIAFGIFLGGGFEALLLLLLFFVFGTLASVWKRKEKASLGLAQENSGKRSVRHAFSNGGIAAICGFWAWCFPEYADLWLAALAGSLSTATGDTLSSELGNLYGRRYFDILSFKAAKRGDDGVISLPGTLIGLLASFCIALVYVLIRKDMAFLLPITLAGLLGNLLDSFYGAVLQRNGLLTNDSVNFLATLSGAIVGGILLR